jgi:hypothetical protein
MSKRRPDCVGPGYLEPRPSTAVVRTAERKVYHRPVVREPGRYSDTFAKAAYLRRASTGCAAVASVRVTLAAPALEHRL